MLVVCLVGGLLVVLLGRQPEHADLPRPGDAVRPDRASATSDLVYRLERLLSQPGRAPSSEVAALTDPERPEAAEDLAGLVRNVRALGIDRLDLTYLGEAGHPLTPEQRATFGDEAWVSEVELTWRLRGLESATSTAEVPLLASWHGTRAVLESTTAVDGYRVPLWFSEPLAVRRTPTAVVLAGRGTQARQLVGLARNAVATVRRTLPGWRQRLVVEAPSSVADFRAATGMSRADSKAIAAVTTTTTRRTTTTTAATRGRSVPRSPVHVFLNPDVFGPLGPQGRQIVVSHEATHVALDAAETTLPLWLSEGTADYVALRWSRLPATVLAAQIRGLVRREGPPRHLPGPDEFDGANRDIGAWYESAWLAAKLIAEDYGTDALLRFYRRAESLGDTGRAFQDVLGTNQRAFTRAWRTSLVELAE